MKKDDLKAILKECIKEVVFEEGGLSTIIAEAVKGVQMGSVLAEQSNTAPKNAKSKMRFVPERMSLDGTEEDVPNVVGKLKTKDEIIPGMGNFNPFAGIDMTDIAKMR